MTDRRHTGRHRAAEEPEEQGVEDNGLPTTDLFAMRPQESSASYPDPFITPARLATLLPGGVGAAAFHAAIHAARTSVSRQPIEGLDDDRIARTGHGQPTNRAGT
jgi:hypothetical protein